MLYYCHVEMMACIVATGVTTLPVHHFQSFTRACAIRISLGIREGCGGDCNEQQDTGSCHDNEGIVMYLLSLLQVCIDHRTESLQFGTDLTTLSHEENIPEGPFVQVCT